ncbi:MAG: M48 family metallopeptidase [Bacteroidetes bacterium]|nr:M48 family metallopeptidase [Bacteroidota bacterium]
MKNYRIILQLAMALMPIVTVAQTLFHSHGTLPAPLTGKPDERAKKMVEERKMESSLLDESETAFIYLTEYSFANFVNSGKLTVGDSVSNYAGRILDRLLAKDPKLRKKITVYTLRSTEVNAFMMANGALLLSTGLLAHIENEAQLAFILSHEIVHFRERHNLQGFRNRQRAESRYFDPMAGVLRFTRELELEADEEGVKIFRNAGYALHEGYSALKMLEHHNWSFGQIPMYPSFFEHGDYRFPSYYTLDKIAEVEKDDVERDESRSTHPGLDKRLRVIAPLLGDTSMRTPLWLVSENSFRIVQQFCRREVINLYLEERNYPEAIYGAYILLQQDSKDQFAREVIGKSLYNLAIYYSESEFYTLPDVFIYESHPLFNNNNDEPDYVMQGPEEVHGECQRLVHFFHQLYPFEWAVLALDWNWKLNEESQFNDQTNQRCLNLMEVLKAWHYLKPEYFSKKAFSPTDEMQRDVFDGFRRPKDMTNTRLPKFYPKKIREEIYNENRGRTYYSLAELQETMERMEKEIKSSIREKKEATLYDPALLVLYKGPYPSDSTKRDSVYFYYRYAFVDYMKASNKFLLTFEDVRETPRENPYDDLDITARSQRGLYGPEGLGLSRVAVMEPQAYWLNENTNTGETQYDGDKSGKMFTAQERSLFNAAKTMGVTLVYMNPEKMNSSDTALYTTYCMLKTWLSERSELGGNSLITNTAYPGLGDSIATRLGTPYVMSSFCTTKKVKGKGTYTRNTTLIYDLRTGEMVMLHQNIDRGSAKENRLLNFFNNGFRAMKRPKDR